MVASHPWGEKMGLFLHATAQAPLPREKQPCEEGLEDTEVTSLILFYRPFCLRVAYFTVQDADAAEDVVQDVSVKVWHTFKRYPPDQRATLRVQAWLWRVVTNEARKYLARWQKWGPYEHDAGQNVDDLEGPARDQPEQAVEAEEEKGSLQQLLNLLPSRSGYRETIELWLRFAGSYETLAEACDCDIRTVRTRFHRATKRLRKLVLQEHIREPELRGWLRAYQLVLEEEWGVEVRAFSLQDYLKGEAYANSFGGHPIRWQFEPEDDGIPDEWLPPSYWN